MKRRLIHIELARQTEETLNEEAEEESDVAYRRALFLRDNRL